MPVKKSPKSMSDDHKAALAAGRTEARAVKEYLEALEATRPRRGRKRTAESVQRRLDAIAEALPRATAVARLSLIQERNDLTAELTEMGSDIDISVLEMAFIKSAKPYSDRKGIRYAAWREIGVPAAVLKAAGIGRGT